MAVTEMSVPHRPFAVEPNTEIMMPDGIFDCSLFKQRITAQVRNDSGRDLVDVDVYFEAIGDPSILVTAKTHHFPIIPAGATVTVAWDADFQNAGPGKPFVSIIAQEAGRQIARSLKKIFVSRTDYDEVTETFICEIPEGRFEMRNFRAAGPDGSAWRPPPECEDPDGKDGKTINLGPYLPLSFDAKFIPNPAYAGTHGTLPFEDPWWKILAIIVALIAAVVGIIAAATSGGTFGVGVKGEFDETGTIDPSFDCCEPDPKAASKAGGLDKGKLTVAGVAGVVTTAAIATALSDYEDPWWRGQRETPPAPGELTKAEAVSASIKFIDPPNAGVEYRLGTSWTYTRTTTGGSQSYSVTEEQTNTHLADGVVLEAPHTHNAFADPLVIKLRVSKPKGGLYSGPELFAFCLLVSPDKAAQFIVPLVDDGIEPDEKASDGAYTGSIHLESVFPQIRKLQGEFEGKWKIYAFAQDVNLADENDLPHIQAQTIGGMAIVSPVHITFDTSLPCPVTAQAVVDVFT